MDEILWYTVCLKTFEFWIFAFISALLTIIFMSAIL